MIGGWSLEEEREVREDRSESLSVNLHSREKFSQHNHINHDWNGEERVLTDVIGGNSVYSIHEDFRTVLIEGSLRVSYEWDVSDDNIMVNIFVVSWVEDFISLNGVVKTTRFRDLFRLESFVFREVLSVIVSEMVVTYDT